jgi:ABC-type bacteriocin/lantibiotic exporter with double-glycine peptidase domain
MLRNIKNFFSIFKPFKGKILILFLLVQITSLLESFGILMLLPLFEYMSDSSISNDISKYIFSLVGFFVIKDDIFITTIALILALFLIKNILNIYMTAYGARLVLDIRVDWMLKIFNKYLNPQDEYVMSTKHGTLLNNLLKEPIRATKGIDLAINYISKLFVLLYLITALFFVNVLVTTYILVSIFFLVVIFYLLTSKFSSGYGVEQINLNQKITVIATESLSAIRQIMVFSLSKKIISKWSKELFELNKINVRFRVITVLPRSIIEIIIVIGVVIFAFYSEKSTSNNIEDILPLIVIYLMAGQKIFSSTSFLIANKMKLLATYPSIELVNEQIKQKNTIKSKGLKFTSFSDDIRFKDLSFGYKKKPLVFDSVNIVIPKKGITAFVGESGQGKSTLTDLVMGFLSPNSGAVLINGISLHHYDAYSWKDNIGYVTQDVFLFNGTIKDNILIGKSNASTTDIIQSAVESNIDDFINNLPDGYNTKIGDKGYGLSGGQKQRIAISRIMIKKPKLIIFDEATSSLDKVTANRIKDVLKKYSLTNPVIVISHDLNFIKNCDTIYKIQDNDIKQHFI